MEIVLITGASSGLGKELAKLYLQDGHNVLLVASNEERLIKAKNDLEIAAKPGSFIDFIAIDLSKIDEIKRLISYADSKNYIVTHLINNAGFGDRTDFVDMDIDRQVNMVNVNDIALLYLCHHYGKEMAARKSGHIINVSSVAGFEAGPYMSTYHAVKGFSLLLSESIGYELGKLGVKVLTLCPGPFESNFTNIAHNEYSFSKIKPATSEWVARKAYKASKKGKKLLILPFKSAFLVWIQRFFPRSLATRVSASTMKKGG